MMMGKVPSFSPGSTVSSALPGYVALCLALQVQRLVSAQFTVTGPDRPITASVSGEAVLPCHLSPRMSAQSMEVRWVRSQDSAVVHLYQNGQDQYENQMLDYQGRTELLKDDITSGSVSLRIRDIRPSDEEQTRDITQRFTAKLQAEIVTGWRSAQLYAVDVTLDPSTANPYLVLAEDRKRVTHRDERQDLPDNPERFDTMAVVLGAEGFTGGRHYWEVEVGEKNLWTLGVCREAVRRKGHIVYLSENGYWTIWQRAGQCKANTSPATVLPVSVTARRLGIFLDYEAGEVSFYNVTDKL